VSGRPTDDTEPADGREETSLDKALTLIAALAAAAGPLPLSAIAREVGLSPATCHRYLASFLRAGMVVQPDASRRYDLGPAATQIGLAAIARMDLVKSCAADLADLVEATQGTALISVWSERGPVVVHWQRGPRFVVTTIGLGTVFPPLQSSTGRVFAAFLPDAIGVLPGSDRASIRADGYTRAAGGFIPGLEAIAMPVLDWQGEAQCVITLYAAINAGLGLAQPDSPALPVLRAFCARHSAQGR
jgi:DNA-binding IclR family transcriptional regulator